MALFVVYIIGVVVAVALLSILAYYEKYVLNESIEDFPTAILMSVGSWIMAIVFYLVYRESYKKIFDLWFHKK